MAEKLRFKPVITRIKLNPEQAVLACSCFARGRTWATARSRVTTVCSGGTARRVSRLSYSTVSTGTSAS